MACITEFYTCILHALCMLTVSRMYCRVDVLLFGTVIGSLSECRTQWNLCMLLLFASDELVNGFKVCRADKWSVTGRTDVLTHRYSETTEDHHSVRSLSRTDAAAAAEVLQPQQNGGSGSGWRMGSFSLERSTWADENRLESNSMGPLLQIKSRYSRHRCIVRLTIDSESCHYAVKHEHLDWNVFMLSTLSLIRPAITAHTVCDKRGAMWRRSMLNHEYKFNLVC